MIRSITMCINHSSRVRKLGLDNPRVHFKSGYNVLIGPNGAGKSTVLKAIASCPFCRLEKTCDTDEIKYITTETLNPLVGGAFASREEMVQGIRAMFQSHGQGVLDSLRSQSHASETVVLIDSPETGQDHENSLLIHEGLVRMSKRYQVIVATNSLIFMRSGNVIDLGDGTLASLVEATSTLVDKFDAAARR
ncbi:MAG TPA: ABC transporter ATP-binding protein [Candidatus Hydrogenedentes bacterium]|nr:ABC transporter ATP-binding protein [Candidatus Hydrogenedentota bacterium]